jgi:RNA polymerase sigma-70 factor (ECF subfamily)
MNMSYIRAACELAQGLRAFFRAGAASCACASLRRRTWGARRNASEKNRGTDTLDHMEVKDAEKDTPRVAETESPRIADSVTDPMEQLAAVYREYPGLRALILRRVQDPELAEDILQDAAITTLEKLRAGEIAQPSGIGGYLYRVALNHWRNFRRKDRTEVSSPEDLESLPDGDDNPDVAGIDRARWAAVVRAMLEELPNPRDRQLLVRFYLNDECKESICSFLGLSDEHFNRVLFRARNRLRELFERRGYQKVDLFVLALLGVCMSTICPAIALWAVAMSST